MALRCTSNQNVPISCQSHTVEQGTRPLSVAFMLSENAPGPLVTIRVYILFLILNLMRSSASRSTVVVITKAGYNLFHVMDEELR